VNLNDAVHANDLNGNEPSPPKKWIKCEEHSSLPLLRMGVEVDPLVCHLPNAGKHLARFY